MDLKLWNKGIKRLLLLVVLFVVLIGCKARTSRYIESPLGKQNLQYLSNSYLDTSHTVIQLLKDKNFTTFADYVHPTKGVRFTPYAFISIDRDLVFKASQVKTLYENKQKYLWGEYDGSGYPIKLTFFDYYKDFIFDLDFSNPQKIGDNVILGKGNTRNNLKEVYPYAKFVEYHFSSLNPAVEGLDWRSLRIVLEQVNNRWFVVGLIHDEWTI